MPGTPHNDMRAEIPEDPGRRHGSASSAEPRHKVYIHPVSRPALRGLLLMALTRFERARMIGARALQIAMGSPTLLSDVKGIVDPMDIAVREFERGLMPITVKRLQNAVH